MSVGWLVGRLVGWLVGWWVGWLVGWFVGWLVDWFVGGSFGSCHLIFFAFFAVLRLAEPNYSSCSTARNLDSRVYGLVLCLFSLA